MLINELGSFNIQWCRLFLQHVSHIATCSLRYERHGQIRTSPGKAARQLNNIGWVCSTQMLSVVFIDGAKMLSWKNVDLHSNPELRIIKTANYYHKISFNEDVYIKFKEILPTQRHEESEPNMISLDAVSNPTFERLPPRLKTRRTSVHRSVVF